MNTLIEPIKRTLEELVKVLSLATNEQFNRSLNIFSGASVGMHARHIIEFYQSLLTQSIDNSIIDYSKRQRDIRLQTQVDYWVFTISQIINQLENLDDTVINTPLSILSESEDNMPIKSSLGRELHYNLEHTIHHAALIKIGLLSMNPEWHIPSSFGVAPSTLRYQAQV